MSDENNKPNRKDDQDPAKFNFKNNRTALFFLVVLVSMLGLLIFLQDPSRGMQEISYTMFKNMVQEGRVEYVNILADREIQIKEVAGEDRLTLRTLIPLANGDPGLIGFLEENNITVKGVIPPRTFLNVIGDLLPFLLILFFVWFMFRQVQGNGNRAFSFGKSKAKKYIDTGRKVTFADVAGQEEAKEELTEVVDFLKNPHKFTKIGARIPTGVLLVGYPGTGKTLMAKAVAGEADVNFFHMSGSDFVEMFVGVGASRVRDLFEQGRKSAPCIIFIDELDAVGRTRGAGYGGGHDEREQTLNQMLVEMDGFDTKDGVIILAATNRPDVLDPALLRPGRFDRQVEVGLPDVKERESILKIHSKKIPLGADVDLNRVARATPGRSGADLANLVNEAALYAARLNKQLVDMDDFEEARDKILMGVAKRSRVIDDEDKKATAYHEAGHALLHYHLENADKLHKVTVIPRGRALGVAFSLPEKDQYTKGKAWFLDRIKIALGGFVAEKLVYGETTSGTVSDLKNASAIARSMVTEWGMSEEIGPIAYGNEDEPIFIGKEIARHKDYSEEMAKKIDKEVEKIIQSCLKNTDDILKKNRDQLDKLALALVAQETLDDSQVRELLGLPELKPADE
jgi:cell division protease FtsH